MKRLFATTALVSALAAMPAFAQTATDTTTTAPAETAPASTAVAPPEGYESYDAAALTGQELQGATVYDVNGDSIGEVSDFVFEMGDATISTTTDTSAATDTTAADTTAAETMATDNTAADMTAADTTATDTTATDATAADTTATDTTAVADADATTADPAAPDATAADTATATAATDTAAATGGENLAEHPTHVVLDIGGFLGIGAHTVAVPTSDLQVFRDANADLRIYLPWTQEQMEALPEYEEGNPATYGAAATN